MYFVHIFTFHTPEKRNKPFLNFCLFICVPVINVWGHVFVCYLRKTKYHYSFGNELAATQTTVFGVVLDVVYHLFAVVGE